MSEKKPILNRDVFGKQHGSQTWFNSLTGEKCREFNYVHGVRHGSSTWWHGNGTIHVVENYINGDIHGDTIGYDDNGIEEYKSKHNMGYRHGEFINSKQHMSHRHFYYVNGVVLLNSNDCKGLTECEKFELQLIHGATWW